MTLNEIAPNSLRARDLFTKSRIAQVVDNQIKFGGAIFMIEGMEYHFVNFMNNFGHLDQYYQHLNDHFQDSMKNKGKTSLEWRMPTEEERFYLNNCEHEAIAYLNRLGQFATFSKSVQKEDMIPRLTELLIFRNKFVAHRSIDMPRDETAQHQEWQGRAFGWHHIAINSFLVFQIFDKDKIFEFHIKKDHPVIMKQGMDVLESVYQS